ncbi:MAG: hypothetical protein AAFO03_15345 [Bacteroidota bacterium]
MKPISPRVISYLFSLCCFWLPIELSAEEVNASPAHNITSSIPTYSPSATINPTLTAAEGFCTNPSNLSSCGNSIPGNPNSLTIGAGESIYLEYDVTNTGTVTLTSAEIMDSEFGTIFDQGASISPGSTVTFRSLQTAPSEPGFYNIDVTFTGQDQAGNEATATGTYTIIVEGPNANLQIALGDGDDFCSDETDIATCSSLPITATNTITLVQNEIYLIEYEVENTGTTNLVEHIVTDNAFGTAVNNSVLNLAPGEVVTFRELVAAPSIPGIYNVEVTYEGTDTNGETVGVISS